MPSRADAPEVSVCLRISLNFPDPPILYVAKYPATIPAPITNGRYAGERCLRAGLGPILEFEKGMAQGNSARSGCGGLQEAAPCYSTSVKIFLFSHDRTSDQIQINSPPRLFEKGGEGE